MTSLTTNPLEDLNAALARRRATEEDTTMPDLLNPTEATVTTFPADAVGGPDDHLGKSVVALIEERKALLDLLRDASPFARGGAIFDALKAGLLTTDDILAIEMQITLMRGAPADVQRMPAGVAHVSGIKVGDTIEFTVGIAPKYLIGKRAVVKKVNGKSVVTDLPDDPAYGRFAGAKGVRCPMKIVRKVEG